MSEDSSSDDRQYGGCEGPEAMYVKLISSDGHEFIREIVNFREIPLVMWGWGLSTVSVYITLSQPCTANLQSNILQTVYKKVVSNYVFYKSHVLQRVCVYFTYKVRYTGSSTEIPEFPIAPEIALELLMAANFLDC